MKACILNKDQFEKLVSYDLPNEVLSTESNLYVIKKDSKKRNQDYMLKYFHRDEGEYFGNKLFTINYLINNSEVIDMEELVLPEKLAIVDKQVIGYVMPFIKNNINLASLLKSKSVSLEEKKLYLKELGIILRKVQSVHEFKNNFYLGDVHAGNFIIDKNDKKLKAVDLDSCKIGNNLASYSRYLNSNLNLKNFPLKYQRDDNYNIIPSANSEWASYVITVLNFIADGPVQRLSVDQYFEYLNYLHSIGYSPTLLECFARIYSDLENESLESYIDLIPNNIDEANYLTYQTKTKKR